MADKINLTDAEINSIFNANQSVDSTATMPIEQLTVVTNAEIVKQLKKAFPSATEKDIKAAVPKIKSQQDINYVIKHEGLLPQAFWDAVFHGEQKLSPGLFDRLDNNVNQAAMWLIPETKLAKVKGVATVGKNLLGAFTAKKVAAEGAEAVAKPGALAAVGKFAAGHKKTTAAVAGVGVLSAIGNFMPDKKSKDSTTTADSSSLTPGGKTAQTTLDALYNAGAPGTTIAQAITDMQAQGTKLSQSDINALQTRYQITVSKTSATSASTVGVYLGGATPEVKGTTKVPLPGGLNFPTVTPAKTGLVDLIQYKQSFPIGDQTALNAFYQKVTKAGYTISGNDPIGQLRTIWDNLGQASMDASRQGKQMTPDQVLSMAAGFSGGGNAGPTVNTTYSPTSKEDVKKMLNAQLTKLTGRTASDADLEAFYNKVHGIEMKKGTKTTTTTVGKNSKTVVTPGYGQTEILAEAEKVAQQDPMYKQLQSANVFGDALSQALGVK